MLRIRVLGAAAGGGFPQWNANSDACRRARMGDPAARPMTQASIALSADGYHWFLINASPDLRQQIEANKCLHPTKGVRSSPITGVVLTNGDVDAVAGLLHLREGTSFALYAHRKVLEILSANTIFRVVGPTMVPRRALKLERWQKLRNADGRDSGIEVKPFPVPGKVPLYMENGGVMPPGEPLPGVPDEGTTIGLEVSAGEAGFFYLANCAAVPDVLAERIAGAPLIFFDGTLYTDDEMVRNGVGAKTGRRMGHMSLSEPDGSMARLMPLNIGRIIFIHINNTNPILLADSPERREVEAAGFEVAYDGMDIQL